MIAILFYRIQRNYMITYCNEYYLNYNIQEIIQFTVHSYIDFEI